MKCCKVIPMYFGKRRKTYETPEDVLALAEHIYGIEKSINSGSGVSVDSIFVNNSPDCPVANKFFDSINGTKTKNGVIKVMQGDNVGISFGAHNKAFEQFRDEYDYWAFTEDDIMINLENYFSIAIEQLNKSNKTGFVAFIGMSGGGQTKHAHSGCGVTSTRALDLVYKKFGRLPHADLIGDGTIPSNWSEQIHKGEVAFTNAFTQVGLNLVKLSHKEKPYIRWTDQHKNVDMRYWNQTGWILKS